MPQQLPITNFVNVSIAAPVAGLLPYAVNNLAIFTKESPLAELPDGYALYLNSTTVGTEWGRNSDVYAQAKAIFSQPSTIISGQGVLMIVPFGEASTMAEIMADASDSLGLFYGGALWAGYNPDDSEVQAAATYAQANRRILYASRTTHAAIEADGIFSQIRDAGQPQCRCLYYTTSAAGARVFAAAYASRLQSVDYSGSSTALNMSAKPLVGVTPDRGVSRTDLALVKASGADCYPSFMGGGQNSGNVFSSGENGGFSDSVQNGNWLATALQVAGFNYISQTSTKIPQNERGVAGLVSAYTKVLQQAVSVGYLAPGRWDSVDLFGDGPSLIRSVAQSGFYIYADPISKQSQADRAERRAPLVRIACKTAGGVDSSNVIVIVDPAPVVGTIVPPPPPIYHNTEQNAEYTATCPDGTIGNPSVGHGTVAAGTYSSSISQEDADAIAYAAALVIATEQANAGLSCVLATEWRQVIFVGNPRGDYWVPGNPYYIGFPQTASGFTYNYNIISYPVIIQSNLNTSGQFPTYSRVEIDFDYTSDVNLQFYGSSDFLTNVPTGSSHINHIGTNEEVGAATSFRSSIPLAVFNLTVTNFRYRLLQ